LTAWTVKRIDVKSRPPLGTRVHPGGYGEPHFFFTVYSKQFGQGPILQFSGIYEAKTTRLCFGSVYQFRYLVIVLNWLQGS